MDGVRSFDITLICCSFTVIRARVEANSILIGVVLCRTLQNSILAGIHSISLNGGLSCERIKLVFN